MEFIRACDDVAGGAVRDAVAGMAGTPEAGGAYVRMGADGTPTKKIDQVAEDLIVDYFTCHLLPAPDQRRTRVRRDGRGGERHHLPRPG